MIQLVTSSTWPPRGTGAGRPPESADFFHPDPYYAFQRRLGVVRAGNGNLVERAMAAGLLAWLPLLILSALAGAGWQFLGDVAAHARYLIGIPLLVLAEGFCARQLEAIAVNLRNGGMVAPGDIAYFDEISSSTRAALSSWWMAAIVIGLTLAATAAWWAFFPAQQWPGWSVDGAGFSAAGWWNLVVSIPLFLVLLFGWFARVALWTRFLARVVQLDLRIVPAHPDRAGGLGFVGHSVAAFAGVAFAIGAVVAGRIAHTVLAGGSVQLGEKVAIGLILVVLAVIFTAPLLVFAPMLTRERQRGIVEYGALAGAIGRALERKWIRRGPSPDENALSAPDFSAAADLGQVVAGVHAMRIVPVTLTGLLTLAAGVLLPFVPILLITIPPEVMLTALKTLLP